MTAPALPPMQAALLRRLPVAPSPFGAEWAAIRTAHLMRRARQLQAAGLVETDTTPVVMGRKLGAGFARLTPAGVAMRTGGAA